MNIKKFSSTMRVAAVVAVALISCKKPDEKIGLGEGQNDLNVTTIDTFTVITTTVAEDSVKTSALSYYLLGALNDANYGKSTASVVTNFNIPVDIPGFSFPAGTTLDSAVLVLEYAGSSAYNGDLTTPLNIRAYETGTRMYLDSAYYSSSTFDNVQEIGQYNGAFNLNDSFTEVFKGVSTTYPPQLRMRLNPATFGQKIINGTSTNYSSNLDFQDYIKGIKVTVENSTLPVGKGAMTQFNIKPVSNHIMSGLWVYYNDTSKIIFPIYLQSAVVNNYKNDFTGTPAQSQINNPADYNTTYIQSMAGSKMLIQIPGLESFINSGEYTVTGARFIFSADLPSLGAGFDAPTRMLLLQRDTLNKNALVVDAADPSYGGGLNTDTKQYTFNVPLHMQWLINSYRRGYKFNRGFYLIIPSDNPVTATRLTLDTQKGTARGIKFILSVIKIK